MSEKIDVRGLSCPLPVVTVRKKLLEMKNGVLEVLVDTGTSRDNITRMAVNTGWKVEAKEEDGEYRLIISSKKK
ncbi:sulfurtransferase TusA family protein [bacterium]|nr:sulfurtransferase TusA family protein [bacterium]MBU1291122.1 sulfurtransferase TusA family protein [bacterium]MBU1428155.1 sulfurtransferase TusA family protein [bacterium]